MEAKYIVVGSFCTHLLWMKQMFSDYEIEQDTMNVMCDNLIEFYKYLYESYLSFLKLKFDIILLGIL